MKAKASSKSKWIFPVMAATALWFLGVTPTSARAQGVCAPCQSIANQIKSLEAEKQDASQDLKKTDFMSDHFPYRLLLIAITACLVRAPTPTVLAQRPDQGKSQSVGMKRVPVFKGNGLDQVARGKKPPQLTPSFAV